MLKERVSRVGQLDILLPAIFLMTLSIFLLNSLAYLTPVYFVFIAAGVFVYYFFSHMEFEVIALFSKLFYIGSIIFLLLPIFIGQATRGTIRWIPIGGLSIQPAEIVRPFLFMFFAQYLSGGKKDLAHYLKSGILFAIPTFLILIQPSLGVTILTTAGFVGMVLASSFPRKYYIISFVLVILSLPLGWGLMADYQRGRVLTFLNPASDPQGIGYNALQAVISVGSGRIFGRGLGRGIQTQLAFLPEKQSDFIFASLGEELGLLGSSLVLAITFFILYRVISVMESTKITAARVFAAGFFLSFFAQVFVHVGMNLNLLPITGVPYPLLSSGGSSLVATMAGLGMIISIRRSRT